MSKNGKKAPAKKAAAPKKEKAQKKVAAPKKDKQPGILDILEREMKTPKGTSVAEVVDVLKAAFPDRNVEGMTTTVRIQVNRLPKKRGFAIYKKKLEGRGLVYRTRPFAGQDKVEQAPVAETTEQQPSE